MGQHAEVVVQIRGRERRRRCSAFVPVGDAAADRQFGLITFHTNRATDSPRRLQHKHVLLFCRLYLPSFPLGLNAAWSEIMGEETCGC